MGFSFSITRPFRLSPSHRRIASWRRLALTLMVLLVLFLGGEGILGVDPAAARVMEEHLASGAILHKSLRTLTDNRGYSWQAIAFKEIKDGQAQPIYLRLVGFPGTVALDRDRPVVVALPSGQQVMLQDRSELIFKTADLPPQPHVGQYELSPVLEAVRSPTSLRVSLPTLEPPTPDLRIPRVVVEEWHQVNAQRPQTH